MKWFKRFKKNYAYLISWSTEDLDTGKPVFGSSQIITENKIAMADITPLAAHIDTEIEGRFKPVIIMGVTYMGRVDSNAG